MKLRKKEKTLTMAAAKAGMARNTARKYLKSGKLPSESWPERSWRTRPDPYETVWPEVEEILKRSPSVEVTAVFDHLEPDPRREFRRRTGTNSTATHQAVESPSRRVEGSDVSATS